eukprot:jgi/Chrzof1/12779/Cz07g07090.t1
MQAELTRSIARVLVADSSGIAVGYVVGWLVADELQILELAVHPDYRGKGVGKALLTQLMTKCSHDDKAAAATLDVRSDNTRAVGFYSKLGFNELQCMHMEKHPSANNDSVLRDLLARHAGRDDKLLQLANIYCIRRVVTHL